ncbi:Heterokaryon incompatibility protein 6 [Lasiodiplodia hormozganensis]|uniref:Heterokaryon incompatibility protein 6 n=1 Tax=Lasiodiplodia hormozganensis TaxID=869390 RepID=A0AA39U1F8_9PEZI|nr:Heterokaryon incompatibility protein 6 [Lasiodiplodia hormozganensis]
MDTTEVNNSAFQYQPLSPSNEIRLITLQPLAEQSHPPKQPGDPLIRCTLTHAHLTTSPAYTALSYVWGNQHTTHPILLNGHLFPVTTNLASALHTLASDPHPPPYLWIDALSINQADAAERSAQVRQMPQIYARAARTTIWLGPSTASSPLALRTLHALDLRSRRAPFSGIRSWALFRFAPDAAAGSVERAVQDALEEVAAELCEDGGRVLAAVAELLERPWFRRVWVVQERALSRRAVVRCGAEGEGEEGLLLPFVRFRRAFWMLCGLRDYLHDGASGDGGGLWRKGLLGGVGGVGGLEDASKVAKFLTAKLGLATAVTIAKPRQPLLHLLALLVGSGAGDDPPLQASDARDFVFALLGLAGKDSPDVRADYSKDWASVKIEVAKACLLYYGLEVLSFCSSHASSASACLDNEARQHCSWAPDWGSKHLPRPFCVPSRFVVRGGNKRSAYSASANTHQELTEESFSIATNGQQVLRLSAVFVDTVSQLGAMFPDSSGVYDHDHAQSVCAWLKGLERLLPPEAGAYGSPDKRQDALWRTPVADRAFVYNYDSVRATHETWLGYEAVMRRGREGEGAGTAAAEGAKYVDIARCKMHNRRPFQTSGGMLAIGPDHTRKGDSVWIFPGADVPFVLRDVGSGWWKIVGEAYVHGIMDGEMMARDLKEQVIRLV